MNWLDFIFFGLGAYLVLRGWQYGIIQTVFRYLSILAGFAAAISLNDHATAVLQKSGIGLSEFWQSVIGYVAVFILFAVSIQAIGLLLTKLVKPTPLRPLDRAIGAAFGIVKIFIFSLLASFLLSLLPGRLLEKPALRKSFVINECLTLIPILKEQWEQHNEKIPELDLDKLKKRIEPDNDTLVI